MIVRTEAYARAGLVGNPSDGYFGKTIAFTFDAFKAEIELWESPELELLPSRRDHSVFPSLRGLHEDVKGNGYYGGFRLLKATCKAFLDYCEQRGIKLDDRNFTLRYRSNIPGQVGLAGSSAIITACVRALMGFYHVVISRHSLANLVLSVETKELAIPAGLQDRVAQAYSGMVYMDFDRDIMEKRGYGVYEVLDASPVESALFVAYREDLSQGTEVFHNNLRARYREGDTEVLAAIERWAELTRLFREKLPKGDVNVLSGILDENFDLRASLYDVGDGNRDLVATARKHGASAKFAGSGGAIVGLLEDPAAFDSMRAEFDAKGVKALRPRIVSVEETH